MRSGPELAAAATQIIAAAADLDAALTTAFRDWAAIAGGIYLGAGYFDSRRAILRPEEYTLSWECSSPTSLAYRAEDRDRDTVSADLPMTFLTDPIAWELRARREYAQETAAREQDAAALAKADRRRQYDALSAEFEMQDGEK